LSEKSHNPTDFYMPAEWEPHEGTWLQWPQDKLYHGYELKLERIWLNMVEALQDHENVHLFVSDLRQRDHISSQLVYHNIGLKNIDFHIIPTNDVWARDNGPIFVINDDGETAIAEQLEIPIFAVPMVLVGGAVEVNGKGTFMATRTSIIDSYRNPGMNPENIERILSQYLGLKHFIWLTGAGRGECNQWGDETDSHIDIIARFTDESTILYNWTDDENVLRYNLLRKSFQELKAAATESGKALTLVPLPLPEVHQTSPMAKWRTSSLADRAYSNYLVANNIVLVPVYGHKNDRTSLKIVAEQFPTRDIIGIQVVALVEHGGAIGCVTQPQPLPVKK